MRKTKYPNQVRLRVLFIVLAKQNDKTSSFNI